jgi:predicted transcriptional regulator
MKAVMLSIQPKWIELIASGKKTVEVRKTKPKIDVPFKCYIYETQGRTETPFVDEEGHEIFKGRGQVIGEFVCDKVDGFTYFENCVTPKMVNVGIEGCLTLDELAKYFKGNSDGYAWHITDLVIYDKPKDLNDFGRWIYNGDWHIFDRKRKPPQSWCYVEELKGETE